MKFLMRERRREVKIAIGFGKSAIGSFLRYALEKCCRGLVCGNSESDFVRAPPKLDQ
nr:MAG TPA: hypothetical protein [Caudoviricetes sp.]